jgi:hypothetical protein
MEIVENFETPDEVMKNRIKLRKYLKELLLNQKRIVKAALLSGKKISNID